MSYVSEIRATVAYYQNDVMLLHAHQCEVGRARWGLILRGDISRRVRPSQTVLEEETRTVWTSTKSRVGLNQPTYARGDLGLAWSLRPEARHRVALCHSQHSHATNQAAWILLLPCLHLEPRYPLEFLSRSICSCQLGQWRDPALSLPLFLLLWLLFAACYPLHLLSKTCCD